MKPLYVLLTAAYCAGIFFLSSSINPVTVPDVTLNFDKVLHGLLYGGLAVTVSLGIRRSRPGVGAWVQFVAPILFAALYAASDEFHQWFVPGRHADAWDWVADSVGALVFQAVLCKYVWRTGD